MESDFQIYLSENLPTKINTLMVSEWAEAKRVLPPGTTSMPGPFRCDSTPYLREIMDCMSESSDVEEVAVLKGTQVGYTVGVLENFLGYIIDECPGPSLFVSGDQTVAEASMALRIDKMIESAGLQDRIFAQVKKKANKKSGDTDSLKEFAGGWLMAVGPNSSAKLRTFSQRFLLLDEIDVAKQGALADGDWLDSVRTRTQGFEDIRKTLAGSTPLEQDTSRIWMLYELGDKRKYMVPCKHCGHKQELKRFNLKYETDSDGILDRDSVHYICENCKGHWKNYDKEWFLSESNGAEWVPTAKAKRHGMRSYYLPAMLAGMGLRTWEDIAQEAVEAEGNLSRQQVLRNTVDALPWVTRHNAPSHHRIMARKSGYKSGGLPAGFQPLIYTLSADVQADRIEAELIAWGEHKRSASVQYFVFPGDTSNLESQCYAEMRNLLEYEYHGGQRIAMAFIDCGYNTPIVQSFCSDYIGGVHPIMGSPTRGQRGEIYKKTHIPAYDVTRVDLFEDSLKQEFYGYAVKSLHDDGSAPFGYCWFPEDYPESYFKALFSETRIMERSPKGTPVYKWIKIYARNEAHDLRVYGLAALHFIAGEWAEANGMESVDWTLFWQQVKEDSGIK